MCKKERLNIFSHNFISQPADEVIIGACGAGKFGDCQGSFLQLKCCRLAKSRNENCQSKTTKHGQKNECTGYRVLVGSCGSGEIIRFYYNSLKGLLCRSGLLLKEAFWEGRGIQGGKFKKKDFLNLMILCFSSHHSDMGRP